MKVFFFGSLAEVTGHAELDPGSVNNSSDLNSMLCERFPKLREHSYRLAVNRRLTEGNVSLDAQDEVAFLPPFAGG